MPFATRLLLILTVSNFNPEPLLIILGGVSCGVNSIIRSDFHKFSRQLSSGHIGHCHIRNDQVKRVGLYPEQFQRLATHLSRDSFKAFHVDIKLSTPKIPVSQNALF